MARISSVKKTGAEAATPEGKSFNDAIDALRRKQYTRFEQLWEKIGADFGGGVKSLSDEMGASESALMDVLAEGSRDLKSELSGWRRAALFWREALAALIGVILVSLLLVRVAGRGEVVFVGGESSLPPFHVITDKDVRVEQSVYVPGSYGSTKEVVGRYLIERAPANSRLLAHQLSKVQLADAAERQLVSLPVRAGAVSATLAPSDRVSLLFVPHKGDGEDAEGGGEKENRGQPDGEAFQVDDVVVLEVYRQGNSPSLVVAIKADVKSASSFLAGSDVVIIQPMVKRN